MLNLRVSSKKQAKIKLALQGLSLIHLYYPENTQQRQILVIHSLAVSGKAMKMLDAHPELRLNCLLYTSKCDAEEKELIQVLSRLYVKFMNYEK